MQLLKSKPVKAIFLLLISGLGGGLIATTGLYLYLSPKLPSAEQLREIELQIPLRIYSQDLKIIAEFGEKKRSPVSYAQIPQPMIDAFLAAEDDRFFSHGGVDIPGLARAVLELVTTGSKQTGGSTITMQVARNFFLSNKREFTRKFNEILLSLRIENELSKEEILSLYANKIYLGNRAYGVGAAAQVYYGKSLEQLTLAEMAMIAGLPKAPSKYNPLANPTRAVQRRNWILDRMQRLGKITLAEYEAASSQPVTASYHGSTSEVDAEYIAEMARQEIIQHFGLKAYTDGYQTITTIDSRLQHTANSALQAGVSAYDERHGYRGPEQKAILPQNWDITLQNTSRFGGLEPAIITAVEPEQLQATTRDGTTLTITWENGLKGLRRYRSENARSAPITSATELFSIGDLIRYRLDEQGQPHLTQTPEVQAALVSLDPQDGAIRALVGGFDYAQSRFNRATQALRQPGSNFKPFLYATALSAGFTPATQINDAPITFSDANLEDVWRPENDGGKFFGPTRLREALYRSRNLVSIRLLQRLGIDRALAGIHKFGYDTSEMPQNLSIALGSYALTPLQIASGYTAFANGGYRVSPYLIDKIIDRNGNIIFQATPDTVCAQCAAIGQTEQLSMPETGSGGLEAQLTELVQSLAAENINEEEKTSLEALQRALASSNAVDKPAAKRAIDEKTAFLIDSMLRDVIKVGTGVKAKALERSDIAGKTGTTNGPRDAWFSGYSPHLVTTTWVGFDDNQLLGRNEYGGSAALPIWIDFMREALRGKPDNPARQPEGIVLVKIDPRTATRVSPDEVGIYEYFQEDHLPEWKQNNGNNNSGSNDPLPDDIF